MPLLRNLLCSTAGSGVDLIRRLVSRACRPPVPPRNWNIVSEGSDISRSSLLSLPRILLEQDGDQRHVDEQQQTSAYIDVQGNLQLPKGLSYFDASSYESIRSSASDSESTLCVHDADFLEFSIYSDVSSPDLNRAMFITPTRPRTMTYEPKVADLTLLRKASDRVSEILRENRRRLDSGEDTNAARKEARRKRAQELANSRREREIADSLFWR